MIGYELSTQEFDEIANNLYGKHESITFKTFLDLFKLQLNDLTKDDIKSAFRVLARDSDEHIPLEVIKEIIKENSGLSENDSLFLMSQLHSLIDSNGNVNYVKLLANFDIK